MSMNKQIINATKALEVLSALENYNVTPEELASTRLGRFINILRKNCQNPQLAKKAKTLVRKWQQLLPTKATEKRSTTGEEPPPKSAKISIKSNSIKESNDLIENTVQKNIDKEISELLKLIDSNNLKFPQIIFEKKSTNLSSFMKSKMSYSENFDFIVYPYLNLMNND
ncbi:MAG: mediator of RNA polymerase II transcription subunit [Paramarteilia canceri]